VPPGGNDTGALMLALGAAASNGSLAKKLIPELLASLRGPWALIFWQAQSPPQSPTPPNTPIHSDLYQENIYTIVPAESERTACKRCCHKLRFMGVGAGRGGQAMGGQRLYGAPQSARALAYWVSLRQAALTFQPTRHIGIQ
jgi:hypothetical protein